MTETTCPRYKRIAQWFKIWENLLEEPGELLLGKSFINVVQATLIESENRYFSNPAKPVERSAKTWERELFGLLEQACKGKNPVLDCFKREFPQDMSKLERLLLQGSFDIAQIYPTLQRIKNGPSATSLQEALKVELLRDGQSDDGVLRAISFLLLRRALSLHSARHLKELPQETLAMHGSRLLLAQNVKALSEDLDLGRELQNAFASVMTGASTERISGLVNEAPTSIFEVFEKVLWGNLSYRLIYQLGESLGQCLREHGSSGPDGSNPLSALQADQHALKNLSLAFVQQYAQAFAHQVFAILCNQENKRDGSSANFLGLQVGNILAQAGHFCHHHAHDLGEHRPNVVDLLASTAFSDESAEVIADTFVKRIEKDEWSRLSNLVAEELPNLFIAYSESADVDWNTVDVERLSTLCSYWSAQKTIHNEMARLLNPLNEELIQRLGKISNAISEYLTTDGICNQTFFWREWAESFSQHATIFKHVVDFLPWSRLTEADFDEVMGGFVQTLAQPTDEWQVTFLVKGIDPKGGIWSTGNVTFFDPTVYDFGEQRWYRLPPDGDVVTLARVAVKADTDEGAKRVARESLIDALNMLSFALSVNVRAGGLRTEISPSAYVTHPATKRWGASGEVPRSEMHSVVSFGDQQLLEFSKAYDHLLKLAAGQTDRLTQLQRGFLLAANWYRKGRWERDHADRFLSYWFGLEHLFVRGRAIGDLFYGLPRLHVTWRDAIAMGGLSRSHQELRNLIEGDHELRALIDTAPNLNMWTDDCRVLLRSDDVEALISLTPVTKSDAKSFLGHYLSDLKGIDANIDGVREHVGHLRDRFRFKLRLLYDLRNRLVHDALSYHPEVELYADELEKVIEDVLKKLVDDAVRQKPNCVTVGELINWYQEPWE